METAEVYEVEEMPKTNAPKMIKIDFSVPESLLEDALELAKAEGWNPSELHRVFWEKGFAVHAEGSNKRLVNRQLRKKQVNKTDE
ncbi:hypothetical protein VF14_08810 [Nostoc linckia z18]|uniref:Uncharacterized protein n=3 Tax=Nostoc linckia TaxID=92942 RepID=A0A9Q5ZEB2_NOSLI|nr:hypothetical protein VF02_24435 [Nostoc linckia z1]PHJ65155.1 hypothetical protein VF05_21715 [Nostoc linckia z3]PHJ69571.1 hypothetical protein VF03_23515 [Nostoc linckia z2]PHJ83726.1 hypothetical protein VF06_12230 [Nostoc linckia z4]PHJ86268.1 hypothetical protein VF07_22160 [Nostoc linckia z6]PHJ96312.1 hypothetical protein VF04_16490 [Nostoc linckia z7]PHK05334.1 hypothetical protein VF08_08115 [Nostoc linckia z8]PHK12519.1 hypothetical protein VF09_03355 [Nostoc linckia z9]PHK2268